MLKKAVNSIYSFIKYIEERSRSDAEFIPGIRRSIQFDNYSCAAHSVKIILQYFKIEKDFVKILAELGTNEDGTDTPEIVSFLIKSGLKVTINSNASRENIVSAIRKGHPILITINDWEHWVVIYGFNKNKLFILDSNHKKLLSTVSYRKFDDIWDDEWIAEIST